MDLKVFVATLSLLCICSAQREIFQLLLSPAHPHPLPDLPYRYDALEPFLDEATLRVHHGGHHRAYTDKMNTALNEWMNEDPNSQLAQTSIIHILTHISEVPDKWQTRIRNNGGGYINHIFYWFTMCPDEGTNNRPMGSLLNDIERSFGSFEKFQKSFTETAATLFGSSYVWLVQDSNGVLSIVTTGNQDSTLSRNLYPILVIDVWEHAYYLKHQNKRSEYITDWWGVVCWDEVSALKGFWSKQFGEHTSRKTEL